MTPANGATEVWLGTHTNAGLQVQEDGHDDKGGGEIKIDVLESRRKISPPIQPVIPKGSVIIRDLKLWHCGKPNLEGTTRVMLAMIHFASWYRNPMRLQFPREWKDENILEHEGLEVAWDPQDSEIDYLHRGNDYEFDQENPLESKELKLLMRN